MLGAQQQAAIDSALDHLFHTDPVAYDILLDSVETISSSCSLTHDGKAFDGLLLAIPVIAWTRFVIPSGQISGDQLQTLFAQLHGHVLAKQVRAALAPALFSIDQLPRSYCDTYMLTRRMMEAAITGKSLQLPSQLPETAPFLADTRYLLMAVAAESGQPLLYWEDQDAGVNSQLSRRHALSQWQVQAGPNVQLMMPGCGIELLLPESYYVACREADKLIRPVSVRAAVHYLTYTLGVEPGDLRAVIAGFGDEVNDSQVDEYRVGFTLRQSSDVVYGIVWPLYGQEDEEGTPMEGPVHGGRPAAPMDEIVKQLNEMGIAHVKRIAERYVAEYCDDCGAPLFADPSGELVHAEMPEDTPAGNEHFH